MGLMERNKYGRQENAVHRSLLFYTIRAINSVLFKKQLWYDVLTVYEAPTDKNGCQLVLICTHFAVRQERILNMSSLRTLTERQGVLYSKLRLSRRVSLTHTTYLYAFEASVLSVSVEWNC